MKILVTIFIFFGFYFGSYAQTDNLQPHTGIFTVLNIQGSYYPKLKRILFDSLSYNTDLRIIVMPSFSPEYLISLDSKNGKTYLTYRIAKQEISSFPETKNNQIKFNQQRIQIDTSIANKIHDFFLFAVAKARSGFGPEQLDGTSYVFITSKNGYDLIAGETWSPKTEKLSGLVTITEWLIDCCKTGEIKNKDKMLSLITDLTLKFKKS